LNRAAAIDAEEKADEEFVRSIFSKNGDVKVSLKSDWKSYSQLG
jgi:hypothetical protein